MDELLEDAGFEQLEEQKLRTVADNAKNIRKWTCILSLLGDVGVNADVKASRHCDLHHTILPKLKMDSDVRHTFQIMLITCVILLSFSDFTLY